MTCAKCLALLVEASGRRSSPNSQAPADNRTFTIDFTAEQLTAVRAAIASFNHTLRCRLDDPGPLEERARAQAQLDTLSELYYAICDWLAGA